MGDPLFLRGYREIQSGSGYCSHSSKEIHLGADTEKLYDIIVFFPTSGIKKVLVNQKPGNHLIIAEEDGWNAFISNNKVRISGFINDYNKQNRLLELFVVIVSFIISKMRN